MRKEGEGNEAISDGSGRILEAGALLQRSYHLGEESEDIRGTVGEQHLKDIELTRASSAAV